MKRLEEIKKRFLEAAEPPRRPWNGYQEVRTQDVDYLIARLESAEKVIREVLETDGQPEYIENMRNWLKGVRLTPGQSLFHNITKWKTIFPFGIP